MKKIALSVAVTSALLGASHMASAYEAGSWLLHGGLAIVSPKSDNGTLADGSLRIDADNSVRPHIALTYMATQNIGVELLAAFPFKHEIELSDAASNAGLGVGVETKQLPPTLSVQYHFTQHPKFQPYVGVGLNYTNFFSTKAKGPLAGKHVSIDDSWGLAGQVGMNYHLNDRWFLNAEARYINIKADVKLDGASIGEAKINPWVFAIGAGYRF